MYILLKLIREFLTNYSFYSSVHISYIGLFDSPHQLEWLLHKHWTRQVWVKRRSHFHGEEFYRDLGKTVTARQVFCSLCTWNFGFRNILHFFWPDSTLLLWISCVGCLPVSSTEPALCLISFWNEIEFVWRFRLIGTIYLFVNESPNSWRFLTKPWNKYTFWLNSASA